VTYILKGYTGCFVENSLRKSRSWETHMEGMIIMQSKIMNGDLAWEGKRW
jgi:hypothetical protein